MEITYISLFSGIGGFEVGLQNSKHNFKCLCYSEIDKYAISIYSRHFPNHKPLGDVTKIKTEDLPNFDFLVGGFPCQSFSVAGKGGGFDDTRGTLFFEIARILKDKRPRYFLLENVKGLLYHDKGETFKTILKVLTELGYNVQWEILNSKDFGVPQNRERIFIKGYSRKECGGEVLYFRENNETSTDRINGAYNPTRTCFYYPTTDTITCTLTAAGQKSGGRAFINVSDDNRQIKNVGNFSPNRHHGKDVFGTNGVSPALCSESLWKNGLNILEDDNEGPIARPVLTPARINKRQNGRRMKEDGEPSFTLTAADRHGVYDGFRVRKLTPRECERLQGFQDDWTRYGADGEEISDTQRYKCCGNAVTTTVITHIADRMFV